MAIEQDKGQITLEALAAEKTRWCVGCGDNSILQSLKKFIVARQLDPATVVNISGIGCSSRAPHYINTYGFNGIHGRAIPIATGVALARPELPLFIHSGDGDAISIGGNHLLHGINKNINCVFFLYDNQIYALTKNQTSPLTPQGQKTNTQPLGSYLKPINVEMLALGMGAGFVAKTADWLPDHLGQVIEAAYDHEGFSFIHVLQRCPHFLPNNYRFKDTDWFKFLTHSSGIPADKRLADKVESIEHDPANLEEALKLAQQENTYFGLYYRNKEKPNYDRLLQAQTKNAESKDRSKILDSYII